MEILEQIKSGTGKQIYNLMRQIDKRRKNGENKPEFRVWWHACLERAKEINATRFGDWEEAKNKLDVMSEPNMPFGEKNRISFNVETINGYPCVYSKEKKQGDVKSRVYITNSKTNTMYLKEFGEVTEKQVRTIFGTV